MQRSAAQLQAAIVRATTDRRRAVACYRLGVFHDNNGREAEAIPCYRRALRLGLDAKTRARATAWLASSLLKTGQLAAARRQTEAALRLHCPPRLRRFLAGLQQRIRQSQTPRER